MSGERFRVIDLVSGRKWDVEAIGKPRTEFGDSLDSKCDGSIREKDSRIMSETHSNIRIVGNPIDEAR